LTPNARRGAALGILEGDGRINFLRQFAVTPREKELEKMFMFGCCCKCIMCIQNMMRLQDEASSRLRSARHSSLRQFAAIFQSLGGNLILLSSQILIAVNLIALTVDLLVVFGFFWWTEPLLPTAGRASALKQMLESGGLEAYIMLLASWFPVGANITFIRLRDQCCCH